MTTPGAVARSACCPPFDPEPWQDAVLHWKDKPFVREHVRCVLHVPLHLGRTVRRQMARIADAQAALVRPSILLSDETSAWGADILIEVERDVPRARMAHLSGTFLSRVFEGPYRLTGTWMRLMERHVAERGGRVDRLYLGYTMCPQCSEAYGRNYVVLLAKVKPREPGGGAAIGAGHWR